MHKLIQSQKHNTPTNMQHVYEFFFTSSEFSFSRRYKIDDVVDSTSFFSLRSGWMVRWSDGGAVSLLSHTCKFFALKTILQEKRLGHFTDAF